MTDGRGPRKRSPRAPTNGGHDSATHDDDFGSLKWIEAIEAAEEKGDPVPLIAQLRSAEPMTSRARELLADLFERRRLRPFPRVKESDITLLAAAEEFREQHPAAQLREAHTRTGQAISQIRYDMIERIAEIYGVRSESLAILLNRQGTAWKRLKRYLQR